MKASIITTILTLLFASGCSRDAAKTTSELDEMAALMLRSDLSQEQTDDLNARVYALSAQDSETLFSKMRRMSNESDDSMFEIMDAVHHLANETSLEEDGIPAHQQSPEREEELINAAMKTVLEYGDTGNINTVKLAAIGCPTVQFPLTVAGISSNNRNNATQVTMVQNGNDWLCDYRVWYNLRGRNVTGTTARMNNLILDFGGRLSAKDESNNGRSVIVGRGRANLRGIGNDTLLAELKMVP